MAADLIQGGLTREVNEELHIGPGYREHLVGLINDDTTDVLRHDSYVRDPLVESSAGIVTADTDSRCDS